MNHVTPLIIGIFAAMALAGCATTLPDKYLRVGELADNAEFSNAQYSFALSAPHFTLKGAPWLVLTERDEPRNTVLYSGVPILSYTYSVTLMGQNLDQALFERFAEVHRKGLRFFPSIYNEACMVADRALYGLQRDVPTRTYMAVCRNSQSNEVYELALTERSRLDEEDSSELFQAVRVFLSSFKFRPRWGQPAGSR